MELVATKFRISHRSTHPKEIADLLADLLNGCGWAKRSSKSHRHLMELFEKQMTEGFFVGTCKDFPNCSYDFGGLRATNRQC